MNMILKTLHCFTSSWCDQRVQWKFISQWLLAGWCILVSWIKYYPYDLEGCKPGCIKGWVSCGMKLSTSYELLLHAVHWKVMLVCWGDSTSKLLDPALARFLSSTIGRELRQQGIAEKKRTYLKGTILCCHTARAQILHFLVHIWQYADSLVWLMEHFILMLHISQAVISKKFSKPRDLTNGR